MRFKEWIKEEELSEIASTTAVVAQFARPVGMLVKRKFAKRILFTTKEDGDEKDDARSELLKRCKTCWSGC